MPNLKKVEIDEFVLPNSWQDTKRMATPSDKVLLSLCKLSELRLCFDDHY